MKSYVNDKGKQVVFHEGTEFIRLSDLPQAKNRMARVQEPWEPMSETFKHTLPETPLEDKIAKCRRVIDNTKIVVVKKIYLERLIRLLSEKIKRDYCS